jgi:ribonuclease HI
MHHFKAHIVQDSICVDAACSGNPGVMEYRGVDTWSSKEIFRSKAYPVGTNNIGEFLAIVHALAVYHESAPAKTIYTDSKIAMGWVKAKKMRSKLPVTPKTQALWNVIRRAELWLEQHQYSNPILKWKTREWGEIPADFGRK